jgi:hypothetical protein
MPLEMMFLRRMPLWLQRLLVGGIAFAICIVSLAMKKAEVISFPGTVVIFSSLPFLFVLPKSLSSYMGNTGIAVYFSILWGVFAASFLGVVPRSVKLVQKFILWCCAIFAAIILLAPRLGGP